MVVAPSTYRSAFSRLPSLRRGEWIETFEVTAGNDMIDDQLTSPLASAGGVD